MTGFEIALIGATFLTSLVAGVLFAFVVVVMPGIGTFTDRAYLAAFQAMDRIIQDTQPVFVLTWAGSVVLQVVTAVLAVGSAEGGDRTLVFVALAVYLVGVQGPTIAVNVPLNNRLQAVDLATVDDATCRRARQDFEPRWNRWNLVRTVLACLTVVLLLLVLA